MAIVTKMYKYSKMSSAVTEEENRFTFLEKMSQRMSIIIIINQYSLLLDLCNVSISCFCMCVCCWFCRLINAHLCVHCGPTAGLWICIQMLPELSSLCYFQLNDNSYQLYFVYRSSCTPSNEIGALLCSLWSCAQCCVYSVI